MLSPSVTTTLIQQVTAGAPGRSQEARDRLEQLTDRERDVALAVGRGLSNAEIARELYLSVPTVKAHVGRLFMKLQVENRAQAMSKADLQQKLWPSTYVLETNLAGLVAEVRQVLNDSADDPRYIRTMHRFGYWFIGIVSEQQRSLAASPPTRCRLRSFRTLLSQIEPWFAERPSSRDRARSGSC
jgi:DNA-binding CsgD family transcriptional regulator